MKQQFFFLFIIIDLFFLCESLFSQPKLTLEEISSGFFHPVTITHAQDSRLFVVCQNGEIKIIDESGNQQGNPFLDIRSRVRSSGGEQGLLGLAFHPEYATNGYFYVHYTLSNGDSRIGRYQVMEEDSSRANPNSEKELLTINQPFNNHNGGDLKFGPDGFLYIALGDGGSGGDPLRHGQDKQSFLGKMLRLDVNQGDPYAIPADNPFVNDPGTRNEIWALGLRNPWRFSFDRITGDMWIGDVGQGDFEEISMQPASSKGGENYGWRCYEGFSVFNTSLCPPASSLTEPVHAYDNTFSVGESVTGGYVYRGETYPLLQGHYIFGDYESGRMWTIFQNDASQWEVTDQERPLSVKQISTFGEDEKGEMYVAAYSSGKIYRIKEVCSPLIPTVSQDEGNLTASEGPNYQWYLNGESIPGANSQSFLPASSGSYFVQVNYANGCTVSSHAFDFMITDVDEKDQSIISIFPNPLIDMSYLNLPDENFPYYNLSILDLQGKIVRAMTKVTESPVKIMRKNLSPGIYIMELKGKKVYRGKIMVK